MPKPTTCTGHPDTHHLLLLEGLHAEGAITVLEGGEHTGGRGAEDPRDCHAGAPTHLSPLPPRSQPAHFAAILFFPQHPGSRQVWDITHIARLETCWTEEDGVETKYLKSGCLKIKDFGDVPRISGADPNQTQPGSTIPSPTGFLQALAHRE